MPKSGYKTITVKSELYDKLNDVAEKEDKSISHLIDEIVKDFLKERNKT